MKIRNIFKQNFLPFSLGCLLASLIFTTMDTYYNKKELERDKLYQEMQDRHRQERLEREDRHRQEDQKREDRHRQEDRKREDRHHQERLEWQDRYHQEVMKELKRKRD